MSEIGGMANIVRINFSCTGVIPQLPFLRYVLVPPHVETNLHVPPGLFVTFEHDSLSRIGLTHRGLTTATASLFTGKLSSAGKYLR